MDTPHLSVLLQPVLDLFANQHLSLFIDGTLGAGGHAEAILKAHPEIDHFIGIDQDPLAHEIAAKRLAPWKDKIDLIRGNFSNISYYLKERNFEQVDGILLDLGVSSMQLDLPERGFSFRQDGPLDMRMDPSLPQSAADLINYCSERELGIIFRDYGEEPFWRLAARTVVKRRKETPIQTTQQLVSILKPVLERYQRKKIHPLTLIFQGLRIFVNRELEVLEKVLPQTVQALRKGGRLGVISFHSLEDRIVKQTFSWMASDKERTDGIGGVFLDKTPEVILLTRKAIEPSEKELNQNPRSRSARLRSLEKV